jgi:tetratricopeptide (TPR) repeat protein
MESKKVEFFNKLSFITLLCTLFICLFFFIPYTPITLDASKGFLLSIGTTLSLLFWLISRLGDGKFVVPKDKLILFAMLIPLIFLISSLFSSSLYISLFGSGFEVGTFGSMLVLFFVFFLSSIYFQSEKRIKYFITSLFIGGSIVVLFQAVTTFIRLDNIFPGILRGVSSGNLVGNWNNFALFLGVIVLLSIFTLEFSKTKNIALKIVQYLLLLLGILLLVIINIPFVWLLVGLFSVIIFVYGISIQHLKGNDIEGEKKKKTFPFTSLVIIFISLIFLTSGSLISNFISNYVSLNNPDVRPSIITTSQIAYKAIKQNPLVGTGPNTFVIDWTLWQPKDIAQTIFWNIDFVNGYSLLSTFAVTTGLLGLLALLLFLVVYTVRSIQSVRIILQNNSSNYYMVAILIVSIYSWITIMFYNPNIVMLMLAFASSGILIGMLVYKKAISVRTFSFLTDPRHSFFSILGLVVLMVSTASLTYLYVEKFTSIIYFSKSLNTNSTMEALTKSEGMLLRAISLDKNDIYYRSLSQVYLNKIGVLINDKTISPDLFKSDFQGLVNKSQEMASLAISQNPKQYLNYMNIGNIYSSLVPLSVSNSYESAVASYNKAFLLSPNNPSIPLARASLEFINKNNIEARKFVKESLNLKTNYVDAIFVLVKIETSEGNLSEAIKQAEYAGEIAPNDPTVFFELGLLRYNNNEYSGAVSSFEKAVILNNSYLNARYFLGLSYNKVGRKDDALMQFNILSKIAPDNQEIKDAINSINAPKSELNTKIENSKISPPLKEKQ